MAIWMELWLVSRTELAELWTELSPRWLVSRTIERATLSSPDTRGAADGAEGSAGAGAWSNGCG